MDPKINRELEELRRELAEIKRDLRTKPDANPKLRTSKRLSDASTPPTPSNITFAPGLSSLTVKWDPVQIRDLYLYRLQVSESPYMYDPTIFETVDNRFTIFEVDSPGFDFYLQIQAESLKGRRGNYSRVYSSASLLTDTEHLKLESATALNSMRVQSGGFYLSSIRTDADGIETFDQTEEAYLSVDFGEAAQVEVASTFQFYLQYTTPHVARTILRFDGADQAKSEFKQSTNDAFVFNSGTLQAQIAGVEAGTHSVSVVFEVDDVGSPGVTVLLPDVVETQFFRGKR